MKRKVFGKAHAKPYKKCASEDEVKAKMSKDEDEVTAYAQAKLAEISVKTDNDPRDDISEEYYFNYQASSGVYYVVDILVDKFPKGEELETIDGGKLQTIVSATIHALLDV